MATPRSFPRCTAQPRLAARRTDGQTSLGTRPAPAAPAGPNGGLVHLSEQNLPVAGRARKSKLIGRRWLGWCIRAIGVRSLPFFSRAKAFAAIGRRAPHVRVQGVGWRKPCFFRRNVGFLGSPKSDKVLPGAGSPTSVSKTSPSQAARETRRESSSMLAGGAPGTVWDDSRCVPCGVARLGAPCGWTDRSWARTGSGVTRKPCVRARRPRGTRKTVRRKI